MTTVPQRHEAQGQRGLRKRLYECQTRLQLLKSITSRISSGLAAPQLIERTLLAAHKSFPYLRISYSTINSERILTILHSVGPAEMPSLLGADWELSESNALVKAVRAGEIIVAFDVLKDDRLHALADQLAAGGTRALIVVPIAQPGREL